ncbi:hypothetical protein PGB90_006924 [Kerria lacca]
MNVPEPSNEHLSVLRKYFGHNQFRPMQWKIIHSILENKRDNCVIMATGYGKSLCYQYPAVFCDGLSIVISPLISLMQDQVFSLNMSNISACFLGSAQLSKTKSMDDIISGKCRILYVTPEWCTSESGNEILNQIKGVRKVTLIAIDEAHCVSQWGHDFRNSYRHLSILRKIFNTIPILALTATATSQVRIDICKSLQLNNPLITCTSFDRPNLYFSVSLKSGKTEDLFKDFQKILVRKELSYKFSGATIIYCQTKKKTEDVANILKENGIMCAAYHAGLSLKRRKEIHEQFVKDELLVIVATVAFGMGIDKSDVRCVIHYGVPKEIESYYQEVGRAGRDGLPATCYIFYSYADFATNNYFIENISNKKFQEHRKRMLKYLQKYLETRNCRRQLLLSYFDDSNTFIEKVPTPNCCDNCTKFIKLGKQKFDQPELNLTEDVKLLLKAIDVFQGRFGMSVPIKFLRGCQDCKIPKEKLSHELFGFGKDTSEVAWKALGRLCLRDGLLEESSCSSSHMGKKFPMSTVHLTSAGKQYIKIGKKCGVELTPTEEVEILFKKKKKLDVTFTAQDHHKIDFWKEKLEKYRNDNKHIQKEKEKQANLYFILKKLRDDLAFNDNVPHNMVATDQMCYSIAINVPSDRIKLAEIDGFTEARLEKYGDIFIQKITEFFGKKTEPFDDNVLKDPLYQTNETIADILKVDLKKIKFKDEFNNELMVCSVPNTNTIKFCNDDDNADGDKEEELFRNIPLEKIENCYKLSNLMPDKNVFKIETKNLVLNSTVANSNNKNENPKSFASLEFSQVKPKRKFLYDDELEEMEDDSKRITSSSWCIKSDNTKKFKNKIKSQYLAGL